MLDDPIARQIISQARQKNVARTERACKDFEHILADFFAGHAFAGQKVLDLGPGQYDFARILREQGGTVENVDNDPAVLELGRYLGFQVHAADLKDLVALHTLAPYDGLFVKFSINAFWQAGAAAGSTYVARLDSFLKPDGWGWVAPWNGVPKSGLTEGQVQGLLAAQHEAFVGLGWTACPLNKEQAIRYGIHGNVANNIVFLKRLRFPLALKQDRMAA